MSKIDNIQKLYGSIDDKSGFVSAIAHEFGIKPLSIRNNWFGSIPCIPEKHEDRLLVLLQNWIVIANKQPISA